MKHRWIVLIAIVCLCVTPFSSHGKSVMGPRTTAFLTAADLQRLLAIGRPWKELTPFEESDRAQGLMYVIGVADAIEGESACILGSPNEGPLNDVVLAHMANNSTDPQASAASIVKLALSKAFPCPTSST